MKIFKLIFTVIGLNTAAQIFFKFAANALATSVAQFVLLLGLAFFLLALSFVCWALALKLRPISQLYPCLALTFLTVPLASQIVFGEELSFKYYWGVLFIIAGVVLCSRCVKPGPGSAA